ncbi:MAG: histidine phosphatase family protein, partial [Clostridia bacterium]|nr:histidine phosphatase family protein [Clostridia bacterium]
MFLLYVRHGQPDYANDCLTDVGRIQAKAVAERFALLGLDKIYSSTMGRAMETAKYTAEKLNLPIEGVDFAREDLAGQDFGVERNGRNTWCFYDEETLKLFASEEVENMGLKWYEDPLFEKYNFKHGVLRVENAVNGFLKELGYERNENTGKISAEKHLYDRVALFAHGGFSMIFLSTLLHIPYPTFCTRFFHFGLSSVTAFKFPDEGEGFFPKTFQYSNDSHLYKENLLDTYD